ncbi:hypothetical protein [Bradyrhizobium sp. USDA 336]|uniref:hypothetical protein n=1 Tax=Bradyrhizobium sp. USDA 336 TaxID=3156311 RepID=UPI003837F340
MTALSEQRVREIYEHFAHGRLRDLEDALDEQIDFLSHAPPDLFPYLGRRAAGPMFCEHSLKCMKSWKFCRFGL